MTLTAMRPRVGLGKGRETSLCRLSHASWLISASRLIGESQATKGQTRPCQTNLDDTRRY